MEKTALILGSTGRFGGHAAASLAANGWTVRRFVRGRDDLDDMARGADLIVNAWNPKYAEWPKTAVAQHRSVAEAAQRHGATVLLPGNVYVFGAGNGGTWTADTPHRAMNTLGRIRVEIEANYRDTAPRTIVLRCGDFLDVAPSGNWFDRVMTKPLPRGRLTYPGRTDADHAWAYLPDAARAAAALADRRTDLPRFADIPFPGYTLTGQAMAGALAGVMDRPVRPKPLAWWGIRAAQPFWPEARYILEMRYLWDMPHRLDGGAFERALPGFRHTPVAEALAAATAHLR